MIKIGRACARIILIAVVSFFCLSISCKIFHGTKSLQIPDNSNNGGEFLSYAEIDPIDHFNPYDQD